jgi:mRNA-degrading endonuclease toxin of MazEF toxin-antitoxin module
VVTLKNIRGTVVEYKFPFSDPSQSKRRPIYVLVELEGDDFIACRISTKPIGKYDKFSILIDSGDFEYGGLPEQSKVYPNSIFTLLKSDIIRVCGRLKKEKHDEIITKIKELLDKV